MSVKTTNRCPRPSNNYESSPVMMEKGVQKEPRDEIPMTNSPQSKGAVGEGFESPSPSSTVSPRSWDLKARGEPFLWSIGGALAIGLLMIVGFTILIIYNGIATFWPEPIYKVTLRDGSVFAGELTRTQRYRPDPAYLATLDEATRAHIAAHDGFASRALYRIGNYDLYNEDFRWVNKHDVQAVETPTDMFFFERLEWGPFIGTIKSVQLNDREIAGDALTLDVVRGAHQRATARRERIHTIERYDIGDINNRLEDERLRLRKAEITYGKDSRQYEAALKVYEQQTKSLQAAYEELSKEATAIKDRDAKYTITLADVTGKEKTLKISDIVRFYPANDLTLSEKISIYLSRWWEFLSSEPREANTEGGVFPAIFGTFCMTVLMSLAVAPFGVIAALYLREYAKQGKFVSLTRICVSNLAGVPSIVYGVFGLGFFAYVLGGSIDSIFYPERLPTPTFGTGGLLWASLTLALLTVPVVIVATEEALSAVPKSMREGSLACGASKWQTIRYVVLPRALPGIMTGLILAMARGAGEVAPLMLVGVVKMAPALPIDHVFPYIHLDRSFMHLGFQIYDLGFQSRNSEAAKPMVYVTTLLLVGLVFFMNAFSIKIRNRLKKKFYEGHF